MSFSERTTQPLRREQIARYAAAVRDFNPMHVDDDFARAAGMPSVIAHGPLTIALALDLVVAQLGVDALRSADVRLKAPVFPGDSLTVVPVDGGAEVRRPDGSVVASIALESRP